MTNNDFIDKISSTLNKDKETVQTNVSDFISVMIECLKENQTIAIQGFGTFDSKKKTERKMYNPNTKSFNIIPAKNTIGFKMSAALKDKINE